ncbi:MAG: C69 family dipeptidase [Myxococcales bacterium]|nr:C69 family dipeptidase [Myxococcales bacterium]
MCDSVVAVGAETSSGTTLFAKNSDRKERECQPFLQFSEASHPPQARTRCTHIEIPQVAETYRVMGHSPWWVWGFEHGVNEHAVAIGNHAVFSKELLEPTPGLIGMDLVRLGLERGRTAREALEVIATLVESYGQGGSALAPGEGGYHNSFLLADPSEAWILETSNRRWVARGTRLDAVSNHFSMGVDWEISSRDLESFARAHGWWSSAGRVDVAAAYRESRIPGFVSEGRQGRARELLRAGRGRHDVAGFQRLLSDHLHGGLVWHGEGKLDEERFWTLCAHSDPVSWTTASLVAPLPADSSAPWPVWIAFATPCTGIFLPVYLDGVLPPALARGGEGPDPESAWWAFKRLQDAAAADWARHTPLLREAWAEFEDEVEAERKTAEASARAASVDGDRDAAALIVSDFMARTVEDAMKRAEMLRARLA